jgi:hypothetical protein
MYAKRYTIAMAVDASGDFTGYSSEPVTGKIIAILYTKVDFANGSTMTLTGEESGTAIWSEAAVNASAVRAPRQAIHSTVGVAALYAAGGAAVLDSIVIANERLKIVVASGGVSKTGTLTVIVGG